MSVRNRVPTPLKVCDLLKHHIEMFHDEGVSGKLTTRLLRRQGSNALELAERFPAFVVAVRLGSDKRSNVLSHQGFQRAPLDNNGPDWGVKLLRYRRKFQVYRLREVVRANIEKRIFIHG